MRWLLALALAAPAACVDLISGGAVWQYPETCAGVQSAFNSASGGDIVQLTAGKVYNCGTTTITLPKHDGAQFVTVRPSSFRNFPDDSTRVCPPGSTYQYVSKCAPNVAANDFATLEWSANFAYGISARAGAAYWYFLGIEMRGTSNVTWSTLFSLGMSVLQSGTTIRDRAHAIVIDRCWLHGYLNQMGPQKAVHADGSAIVIRNSAIEEFKHPGQDGQGIFISSGPGPVIVENNFLAGGAENLMAGGAGSLWKGSMPSGITFRGNLSSRDPRWWIHITSDPSVPGTSPDGSCVSGRYWNANGKWHQCVNKAWKAVGNAPPTDIYKVLKNLFEIKGAKNVLVEGNIFDNYWAGSSQNAAVLLLNTATAANGYTLALEDASFRFNRISNTPGALAVGQAQTGYRPVSKIRIEHNVFDRTVMPERANADANASIGTRYILTLAATAGPYGVTYRHNSFVRSDQPPTYQGRAVYTYGIWSSTGETLCPYCLFLDNVAPWNSQFLSGGAQPDPWVFFGATGQHSWDWGRAAGNVFTKDGRTPSSSQAAQIQSGTCCTGNYLAEKMADVLEPVTDAVNPVGTGCGGESCQGKATDAANPGADIDTVTALTAQAAEGKQNPYLNFRLGSWAATAGSATIYYQAPAPTGTPEGACAVTLSLNESMIPAAGAVTGSAAGVARVATITGLEAGRRYYYKVSCGQATRKSELRTRL